MPHDNRPELHAGLDATEFGRWYWLKAELIEFARRLGVSTSGSKSDVQARVARFLSGEATLESTRRSGGGTQLSGPLSVATVIPPGQRCTQVVRSWFVEQVGTSFRFSAALRDFFSSADGTTTLGDALVVWREDAGHHPIDQQFEYNRFTRRWWAENPSSSRQDLLDAWRRYRATPTDQRDRA